MKKNFFMRRLVCVVITVALVCTCVAIPVFAQRLKDKCKIHELDTSLVDEKHLDCEVTSIKVTPYDPSVYAEKSTEKFSDVPDDHWAKDYIYACQALGYINGYGDGTFRPEAQVTNGEFIKLLWCAYWNEKITETLETDGHWARVYVNSLNWVLLRSENYPDEKLDEPIDRESVADFMSSFFVNKNIGDKDRNHFDRSEQYLSNITDESDISEDMRKYVNTVYHYGLMNGFTDGSFKPKGYLTRAQAAKLVYELVALSGIIPSRYELTISYDGKFIDYTW